MLLKNVRMTEDHAEWKAGDIRVVDADRCARLVADGKAVELPEVGAPGGEVDPVTRPRTGAKARARRARKGA
jgi:hypothetical protein